MPKIKVNDITMNYEQQGTGEPLLLIPYLAADNACYAFQLADWARLLGEPHTTPMPRQI